MGSTALVADVGGTNARIALARVEQGRLSIVEQKVVPTPRGSLLPQLREFLAEHGLTRVEGCAVAAAGRVHRSAAGGRVALTNAQLTISTAELATVTSSGQAELVNDLAAVAAALPAFAEPDLEAVSPAAEMLSAGLRIVIGVGTGFGLAALTHGGELVDSEAGHINIAAVTAEEQQLLQRVRPPDGRLSVEDLLSGRGLPRLHEAVTGEPHCSGAAIAARAQAGEPGASETLQRFSAWLGRVVGDMVLAHGAWRGVYLIGGALEGVWPCFDRQRFLAGMCDKAHFAEDLAAVPVWRVVHPQPALPGLARLALAGLSGSCASRP